MNPEFVRKDFPLLIKRNVIYFDNAATSHKPSQVIESIREFYETHNSNVHRGLHSLSMEASRMYEEAHEVVRKFIGAKHIEEVVFSSGTTHALNMIAYMILPLLNPGDNIIISIMEHHSNMLPWIKIAKLRGAEVRVARLREDYMLDYEELARLVDKRTKVIAVTHMSNVLGTIVDIRKVSKLAQENESFLVVDGAQSVPHIPVSTRELNADFLVFSGHKMLGPTGIGVLYIKKEIQDLLEPPFTGGGIVERVSLKNGVPDIKFLEMPWRMEPGTPNIAGAVGLSEAIKYLMKIGMNEVMSHEKNLVTYFLEQLEKNDLLREHLVIYGPTDTRVRGGIISFNIDKLNPNAVASFLDTYNIAVRSGYHCAHPLHEYIGASMGSVRASFYIYNTKEEIDTLIRALEELIKTTKLK